MKKLILFLLTILSASYFVACSKSRSGGGSNGTQQQVCPAGQTMTAGGCSTTSLIPSNLSNFGYYAEKGNSYSSSGDTLTLASNWTTMLKSAMGVCDRCANSSGAASCSSWTSGFNDIVIQGGSATSNQVKVTMRSSPKINGNVYYYWSAPNLDDFFLGLLGLPMDSCYYGIQAPVLQLQAFIETHNDGKGFVVYGQFPYGSAWGRRSFRLYVEDGKIGDTYADFRMVVKDENGNSSNLATGRLNKCQTTSCGL